LSPENSLVVHEQGVLFWTYKWFDDFHYNEKGHEVVVVASALKALLLQPCLEKLVKE
jgi:hypothetical protein